MGNIMLNNNQGQYQSQQMFDFSNMTNEQAQVEAQRQLSQNPNLAQRFQQVMQQNQGKSYWDVANDLARQRGINLNMLFRRR